MADRPTAQGPEPAPGQGPGQVLVINTQYVKDFSFENPNAPAVYAALSKAAPEIKVNIDVRSQPLRDRTHEVVLRLRVEATAAKQTAFLVELEYAGIVTLGESLSGADSEALLMIETPRYLFPFARSILAEATRDGAFPPLVINPIDFVQLYRMHKSRASDQGPAQPAKGANGEAAAPETKSAASEA